MSNASEVALSARGPGGRQEIRLKTESSENVSGFIVANSLCPICSRPTPGNDVLANMTPEPCECGTLPGRHPVLTANEYEGQELVICGAGPSLSNFKPFLQKFKGEIWGANRALNYLHEWGVTKAKGVAIDPGTAMFGEVWVDPPPTEYYLATSVNPGLVWHLEARGHPIRYFHSLRGGDDEPYLYRLLYPDTALAGRGLNVVNRALDLALYMGFKKVYLAGADNALGSDGAMYADGGEMDAADVWLQGEVDGKKFRTKADMLQSATDLVRAKRDFKLAGKRVVFLGKTLPAALDGKSDAYLSRVIRFASEADYGRGT